MSTLFPLTPFLPVVLFYHVYYVTPNLCFLPFLIAFCRTAAIVNNPCSHSYGNPWDPLLWVWGKNNRLRSYPQTLETHSAHPTALALSTNRPELINSFGLPVLSRLEPTMTLIDHGSTVYDIIFVGGMVLLNSTLSDSELQLCWPLEFFY